MSVALPARPGEYLTPAPPPTFHAVVYQGLQIRPVLAVLASILVLSSPVLAQTTAQAPMQPGRPFRGLFGTAHRNPDRYKSLDLTFSFLGGYDENAAAGTAGTGGGITDPRFGESSGLASASASLLFEKVRNEDSVYASGRTGFRYYPSLTDLNAADFSGAAGFSKRAGKAHFAGNGDAGYQPFFSLLAIPVFPGAGLPPTTADFAYAERPSLIYGGNLETTLDFNRRTHATGGYGFRGFDTTRAEDLGRLRQHNVRAGLTRDLSRRVNVGGRYTYDYSDGSHIGPGTTTRSQGGELTFDYHRTLRSRRTVSLGWSVGYTAIETTSAEAGTRSDSQMTAGVRFAADIGRSWNVNADYRRGMRRLAGVVAPVFSNDLQARVGGVAGRRVDLEFSGMYSKGSTSVSAWTGYDSASGTTQVRWLLNRATALRGNYIYYWYQFPLAELLPAGVDRRVSRNAVRVGIDIWLPLYR